MFKMYLVRISDLEDEAFLQKAQTFIDSHRSALIKKYKKKKDRMRAIVAGLLLQIGFWEAEFADGTGKEQISFLQVHDLLAYLEQKKPVELSYVYGAHGKPDWDRRVLENGEYREACRNKKCWHFNLSHSGEYVLLAIADTEVGADIQEAREVKHFPGGFKAFSRMEAYVKCTGEGYAQGCQKYLQKKEALRDYRILEAAEIAGYAAHICLAEKNFPK